MVECVCVSMCVYVCVTLGLATRLQGGNVDAVRSVRGGESLPSLALRRLCSLHHLLTYKSSLPFSLFQPLSLVSPLQSLFVAKVLSSPSIYLSAFATFSRLSSSSPGRLAVFSLFLLLHTHTHTHTHTHAHTHTHTHTHVFSPDPFTLSLCLLSPFSLPPFSPPPSLSPHPPPPTMDGGRLSARRRQWGRSTQGQLVGKEQRAVSVEAGVEGCVCVCVCCVYVCVCMGVCGGMKETQAKGRQWHFSNAILFLPSSSFGSLCLLPARREDKVADETHTCAANMEKREKQEGSKEARKCTVRT